MYDELRKKVNAVQAIDTSNFVKDKKSLWIQVSTTKQIEFWAKLSKNV